MNNILCDEWQATDAEAAQATIVSKLHCTYIPATGIHMLDGM